METSTHVESSAQRDSVLEYMAKKHETLANDYKVPDGKSSEHCRLIAEEIALLLSEEGKLPYILRVHSMSADGVNSDNITPKVYMGKIRWCEHHICCEGDLIYDPMLSATPVSFEDYNKTAFEEEIEGEIWSMALGDF